MLTCSICGKTRIKSQAGLHKHQATNTECLAIANARKLQLHQAKQPVLAHHHQQRSTSGGHDLGQDDCLSSDEDMNWQVDDQEEDTQDDDLVQVETVEDQHLHGWGVGSEDDDPDVDPDDEGEPTTRSLRKFRSYCRKHRDDTRQFTQYEEEGIKLLDILKRKKCPLDAYGCVKEWATGTTTFSDYHGLPSRNVLMKKLQQRYMVPNCKEKIVVLPSSRAKANIVYQDAEDAVVSLLTDPRFTDDDFLHFGDNPLAPPPANLDKIADINTGKCYTETYKELITKPQKQMLVPIILYIDGAVTSQFAHLPVTALKMTLGILNRNARNKEFAWRTLGYDPNFMKEDTRGQKIVVESGHDAACYLGNVAVDDEEEDVSDGENPDLPMNNGQAAKADMEMFEEKETKPQDLHRILAEIMESLRKLEDRGMVWDYRYRGRVYKGVELVFFVAFVKCDTDEADKLCGHYCSRNRGVGQICRYCTCPTDFCDQHDRDYPMKTAEMIRKLVENNNEEQLKSLSQHNIRNAFHVHRFGQHNRQGIHGACPMDMLHHILLGVFMYVRLCFIQQIGKTSQSLEDINGLAKAIGHYINRQSDRDRPKTNFSGGISKGKITGKEMSGVLLLIAAVLQTEKGKQILRDARSKEFGDDWLLNDWSLLVETMLEWEAFMKSEEMNKTDVQKLKRKHRYLMFLFKKIAKRSEGMGMKLLKFHAILHLYQDIVNFGVPSNVDTGANESHHKLTKVAAMLTQRDITKFEWQTAMRLLEFHLIDLAMSELQGAPLHGYFDLAYDRGASDNGEIAVQNNGQLPNASGPHTVAGTKFAVRRDEFGVVHCKADRKEQGKSKFDNQLLQYLGNLYDKLGERPLDVRTEHKRGGQIFRGCPNYRKTGVWKDWAIFDWGIHGQLPGEIGCFVDLSYLSPEFSTNFSGVTVQRGIYAVIESTYTCPNERPTMVKRSVKRGNKRVLLEQIAQDADGNQVMETINNSSIFTPVLKEGQFNSISGELEQRTFYLADVESIVAPAIVIPDIGSMHKGRYLRMIPRREWATNFVNWLRSPHTHDEAEMTEEDGDDSDE